MDKGALVEQLIAQLRTSGRTALRASADAAREAREGATAREKRQDSRVAIQNGHMATAQSRRGQLAISQAESLVGFRPPRFARTSRIDVGAVVEVEDEDNGEGRTFFLAPVGAGITLSGPGGDGLLSVVTPASPVGKSVIGKRVDDVVDVTIEGSVREWLITYVA